VDLKNRSALSVFDQTPLTPNENAVCALSEPYRGGEVDRIITVCGGSSIGLATSDTGIAVGREAILICREKAQRGTPACGSISQCFVWRKQRNAILVNQKK
jgi:alcohol dehydrogenase class IV